MQDIGFGELEGANFKFAYAQSVQSRKHNNAYLMVNKLFTHQVPMLALATETARVGRMAYKKCLETIC